MQFLISCFTHLFQASILGSWSSFSKNQKRFLLRTGWFTKTSFIVSKYVFCEKVWALSQELFFRQNNSFVAVMKGSKSFASQVDAVAEVYTWTVSAIKQSKHVRKMNMSLRSENKMLKEEVSSLKGKLGKLANWSKGKFAFQILVNFGCHHFETFWSFLNSLHLCKIVEEITEFSHCCFKVHMLSFDYLQQFRSALRNCCRWLFMWKIWDWMLRSANLKGMTWG